MYYRRFAKLEFKNGELTNEFPFHIKVSYVLASFIICLLFS